MGAANAFNFESSSNLLLLSFTPTLHPGSTALHSHSHGFSWRIFLHVSVESQSSWIFECAHLKFTASGQFEQTNQQAYTHACATYTLSPLPFLPLSFSLSLTFQGCGYVLGLHLPSSRDHPPSLIPLQWQRHPWWPPPHEWLWLPHLQRHVLNILCTSPW